MVLNILDLNLHGFVPAWFCITYYSAHALSHYHQTTAHLRHLIYAEITLNGLFSRMYTNLRFQCSYTPKTWRDFWQSHY